MNLTTQKTQHMKKYNVIIEHAVSSYRDCTETIKIDAKDRNEAMRWARYYSRQNNFSKIVSVKLAK